MFGLGAKSNIPQTSQYDFKGTTVSIFTHSRSNHHQAHINPHHLEQEMLELQEVMEDQDQIEVSDSLINYLKKPIN
jgi:hypothetical protein